MHKIRILLLALFFLLGASASVAAQVHKCCPFKACSTAQCIDMGCAPTVVPAAFGAMSAERGTAPTKDYAAHTATHYPDRYEEVWTPPD